MYAVEKMQFIYKDPDSNSRDQHLHHIWQTTSLSLPVFFLKCKSNHIIFPVEILTIIPYYVESKIQAPSHTVQRFHCFELFYLSHKLHAQEYRAA